MTYVVLYTDGTMGVYANRQHKQTHQDGARFFECHNSLTIVEISEWYALNHSMTTLRGRISEYEG